MDTAPVRFPPGFTTDGCTGFLDHWRGIDLTPCCDNHDLAWYLHPGDWWVWFTSNVDLGVCFAGRGAWELAVPAIVAVMSIGALLFAGVIKNRNPRRPPPSDPD